MNKERLLRRWESINEILKEKNVGAFITADPVIIQYIIGYLPMGNDVHVLIVGENSDIKMIAPEGTGIDNIEILEYCAYSVENIQDGIKNCRKILSALLKSNYGSTIGLIVNRCPGWIVQEILDQGKDIMDLAHDFDRIIVIKEPWEIECINKTLTLNSLAYDRIRLKAKQGMTEIELYNEISGALNLGAQIPVGFIADLVSGQRSSEVSGLPTMRQFKRQDAIIVDLLPQWNGYYCDTTRTFFIGSTTEEQRNVYKVLHRALQEGVAALKPGIKAEDVYFKVAGAIEDGGYGKYFPHHAGHGVGMGYFEPPYFIQNSPMELKEGMVVTLEPGIYLPGEFGIRIENNYLITSEGCICLFEYPLGIDDFIIDDIDERYQ